MNKWYYSIAAKTGIFVALIISVAVTLGGILGCIFLWTSGAYTTTKRMMVWNVFEDMARQDYYTVRYMDTEQEEESIFFEENNISYEIFDEKGKKTAGNYDGAKTSYAYEFTYTTSKQVPYEIDVYESVISDRLAEEEEIEVKTVKIYVDEELSVNDKYAFMAAVISVAYGMRFWIYPMIIVFAILSLCCFVFLMCGAGHRNGKEGIQESVLVKLPLEVYVLGVISALSFLYMVFIDMIRYGGTILAMSSISLVSIILFLSIIGCCMNFAVRAKTGRFWNNTVFVRVWHFSGKCSRVLGKVLKIVIQAIPMAWRVVGTTVLIFMLEFFLLIIWSFDPGDVVTLFIFEKMLVMMLILYLVYCLCTLQKGGKALANGSLSYQIDSKGLIGAFKEHADDLNSIRDGMNAAVNERMKSERMKTELITNVSHDIKTPLTSIINYTDLIVKEQSENEKINEYAGVLERQSARLKKLIEDLVEASKASTGNLEVSLTPMEVGVMVTQVAGEYTERLALRHLTLVTKQPEEEVKIMADGRHLWRVLDNLMNNVCKYAQPGTRVYLSVEEKKGVVRIILKNTSEYALDVEADELMERFVRGDESRSTEGNGLGLSIAQSLTELQKGKMQLTVDGDLFKVILEFPVV